MKRDDLVGWVGLLKVVGVPTNLNQLVSWRLNKQHVLGVEVMENSKVREKMNEKD